MVAHETANLFSTPFKAHFGPGADAIRLQNVLVVKPLLAE